MVDLLIDVNSHKFNSGCEFVRRDPTYNVTTIMLAVFVVVVGGGGWWWWWVLFTKGIACTDRSPDNLVSFASAQYAAVDCRVTDLAPPTPTSPNTKNEQPPPFEIDVSDAIKISCTKGYSLDPESKLIIYVD